MTSTPYFELTGMMPASPASICASETPIAVTDHVVAKIFSDITDRIVEMVEKRK